MPSAERTLYQFPISHYCEKTRWNLDAKGLPYALNNLMPGPHLVVTRRLVQGPGTVPVLVDGGTVLGDSTDIALHLERTYPSTPALVPASGPERDRVLELENFFDEMGVHVRRWMYAHLFNAGADLGALMFREYATPQRLLGRALVPVIKALIRRKYKLLPEKVEKSRVRLMEGLDRLEREIGDDPARYLVGNSLTIADITAASLYAPLVGAEGSPYTTPPGLTLPPVVAELQAAVRARPAGQWMLRRYQQDRRPRA